MSSVINRSPGAPAIEAEHLAKHYGPTPAVVDVSLAVPAGTIFGVLGPNGAGKSTTVRILTTMTAPDAGRARVAGLDVATDGARVRSLIGVTGQDTSLDELLTGRQNLRLIGELAGLARRRASRRADELLEQFGLADAGNRTVRGYSGGMRRRLDLAASIVADPPVLFLDEPTTGLDPASRQRMWEVIRGLVERGTTLLLTTQYLDEADVLADRIAVIDHGRVIAEGTASELKAATGEAQLELTLTEPWPAASALVAPFATGPVVTSADGLHLRFPVRAASGLATQMVRVLDGAGVVVDDIAVHHPSLDDVFFSLTGAPADPASGDAPDDPLTAPARRTHLEPEGASR